MKANYLNKRLYKPFCITFVSWASGCNPLIFGVREEPSNAKMGITSGEHLIIISSPFPVLFSFLSAFSSRAYIWDGGVLHMDVGNICSVHPVLVCLQRLVVEGKKWGKPRIPSWEMLESLIHPILWVQPVWGRETDVFWAAVFPRVKKELLISWNQKCHARERKACFFHLMTSPHHTHTHTPLRINIRSVFRGYRAPNQISQKDSPIPHLNR